MKWEDEVRTFLPNWSEDLMKFSIPTIFFPLTEQERDDFASLIFSDGSTDEQQRLFGAFKEKIAPAFDLFPDGIFVRNDRRSPKDSDAFFLNGMRPARNPGEAIGFALSSERTWEDFKEAKRHNHLPVLIARKWMDFKQEREFRCFVKEGKLFAISQYDYYHTYEWVEANASEILRRIASFFEEIKELLPCDSIVFDVHLNEADITLIETNPYGLSDPCLFVGNKELDMIYTNDEQVQPQGKNRHALISNGILFVWKRESPKTEPSTVNDDFLEILRSGL